MREEVVHVSHELVTLVLSFRNGVRSSSLATAAPYTPHVVLTLQHRSVWCVFKVFPHGANDEVSSGKSCFYESLFAQRCHVAHFAHVAVKSARRAPSENNGDNGFNHFFLCFLLQERRLRIAPVLVDSLQYLTIGTEKKILK